MRRWLADFRARPARSLAPVVFLALAPKCAACWLAYVGLAALFGRTGPLLCGATAGDHGSWTSSLALAGLGLGLMGSCASLACGRSRAKGRSSGMIVQIKKV